MANPAPPSPLHPAPGSLPPERRRPGTTRLGKLADGAGAPLRGARFALAHPRLWGLVLAPVATTAVALLLLLGSAVELAVHLSHRLPGGTGWFAVAYFIILGLIGFALGYLIFFAVLSIVAAPFCSLLAEKVVAIAGGRPPPRHGLGGALREALRGTAHALLRLLLFTCIAIPLSLLSMLLPPVALLSVIVTCFFVAYDLLDYPLSLHQRGFADKWGYLGRHRVAAFGLGGATALLLAVPLVNLFVPPCATIGATLLYLDREEGHV